MKKALVLVCFLLSGWALFAEEAFESQIIRKEIQEVFGNGTLSAATDIYSIIVVNTDKQMKIEVSEKAYGVLKVGDWVKVTYEPGLLYNDIKGIALLRRPSTPKP